MHKVERMTQHPATCLHCGRGNTVDGDDTMDEFWAIDLERDVNWGDSTYICKYCVDIIAQTAGFVTLTQLAEQQEISEHIRQELHSTRAEFDSYRRRVRTMLAGRKAEKRVRSSEESVSTETKTKAKRSKAA